MDINRFGPFQADIWGTVSDWAMVIVTGLTLFYIVKTFKSQYKVQKLQQQSTNIENERFRIEILPIFEMKIIDKQIEKIEEDVRVTLSIDYQLITNECLNLLITPSTISSKIIKFEQIIPKLDYIANKGHRVIDVILSNEKKVFDIHGSAISLIFNYEDLIGNKYVHDFVCSVTYTEKRVISTGPFRVLKTEAT